MSLLYNDDNIITVSYVIYEKSRIFVIRFNKNKPIQVERQLENKVSADARFLKRN